MSNPDDTTTRLTGSALDDLDLAVPDRGANDDVIRMLEGQLQQAQAGNIQGAILIYCKLPTKEAPVPGVGHLLFGKLDTYALLTTLLITKQELLAMYLDTHDSDDGAPAELVGYPCEDVTRIDGGEPLVDGDFVRQLEQALAEARNGSFHGAILVANRIAPPQGAYAQPAGMVIMKGAIATVTIVELQLASQGLVMWQQQQQQTRLIVVPT